MRNERGEILIILGLVALILAFAVLVWEVPCDTATQKCIDENSRTMETPPGVSR